MVEAICGPGSSAMDFYSIFHQIEESEEDADSNGSSATINDEETICSSWGSLDASGSSDEKDTDFEIRRVGLVIKAKQVEDDIREADVRYEQKRKEIKDAIDTLCKDYRADRLRLAKKLRIAELIGWLAQKFTEPGEWSMKVFIGWKFYFCTYLFYFLYY